MTENQLRLSKEVAGGKKSFRKAGRSVRELEEFEAVVQDQPKLEAMGYIGQCEALTETQTGRQYVGRVFVRVGLGELGREALKN